MFGDVVICRHFLLFARMEDEDQELFLAIALSQNLVRSSLSAPFPAVSSPTKTHRAPTRPRVSRRSSPRAPLPRPLSPRKSQRSREPSGCAAKKKKKKGLEPPTHSVMFGVRWCVAVHVRIEVPPGIAGILDRHGECFHRPQQS